MSKCACGDSDLLGWYYGAKTDLQPHKPWVLECRNCGFYWGDKE